MTRPIYRDAWAYGEKLTTFDPDIARRRISAQPVCEVKVDGTYCRRLSVSAHVLPGMAADVPGSYRADCPEHAAPDAPRWCLTCNRRHQSPNGYRCAECIEGESPVSARRVER